MSMKTNCTNACLGFIATIFTVFAIPSFGQLNAKFTSNIQSGCTPLIVSFQDQSTGNPTSWKWTLGNGSYSTNQNPVTTYFNPGVYTVKLVVQNSSGADSVIAASYITVYANPQVTFSGSPTQGCFPLDVNFTNTSKAGSGTITDYLWDFGDGNISTDIKAEHIYTTPGTFDVTLKVTNSYGCTNALTNSDMVTINDGVNADFSLTSLDVCTTPATAIFRNNSEGSGSIDYLWNFGDGQTSTLFSPSHKYNNSGTFHVLLTAQSAGGCTDTATMDVVIAIPTSSFKNTDATCSNQSIFFTNTSVPAPVSSTWYFGDGTKSTELNPEKIYTKTGTYTVKLVNTFSSACSDSITKTITIASGPSVSFKADDTVKCVAPLNVNFTNTTTGNAVQYIWDFGDGNTSQAENPAHVYTKSGTFTVTLTAISSSGCQNVFRKVDYINILPIKITQILNLPDSGCIPLAVKPEVQLNIITPIRKYTWDFGDGETSGLATPVYTYNKEGIYTVKVTIETVDGCTDTYILNNAVLIGHKPKADFTSLFDTVCANATIFFTNTSTNGPITFLQWDNNAIQDSASGQIHYENPSDTGYHTVRLIAFNYGCTDTLLKTKAFYALPPIARMLVTLNCTNKTLVNFTDTSIVDKIHKWDFGDGITDIIKNPTHVYASPGVYTINLYTQTGVCMDTATKTIHVINEQGQLSLPGKLFCRGNNFIADITGINLTNIRNTKWDFGDGTIITLNGATKATHAYLLTGRFKITATITDLNNCQYMYSTPDSVTVFGPLSNFISLKPGACQGGTVTFTDKSETDGLHSIIKWSWDYGDKVNHDYNNLTTFSHTYPDTGYYSIRLTVTDSYGCSDSARRSSYVYISHPDALFLISDSIACPGKSVSFQNNSTGSNLQYVWYFGDGAQSNQKNPSYNYKNPGIFFPALSVTDINGCKDSVASKPIRVSTPAAKFNMSDSFSSCPPLQVNFSNNSTDYSSFSWNFGDGSTSLLDTPVHLYTYPGVYPVKLITKGYGSCADTLIKNITIKGPTGTLTYDSLPQCYPAYVKFSATASHTQSYTWDFSDGNAIITQNNQTSHTYDTGFFIPKLILTDSLGCKVAIVGADTVKVYNVTANAILSDDEGCDSVSVKFTDASQSQDVITHHIWYFGDADSADVKQVTHTYTTIGNFNAKLIAVTKLGCRDTLDITAPVVVHASPDVKIYGDTIACATATVNFTGTNNIKDTSQIQWNWNFGNGLSSTGQNVSTSFNAGGNYNVSLIGINKAGCADTSLQKIKINPAPAVSAGPDITVCQNSFYQLSASGAIKYLWQGVGLSCTNCASPNTKVDSVATYIVTGSDAIGCKASDTITLKAITPLLLSVSGRDTLCVGEKTQFFASGAKTYQWSPAYYLDNDKSPNPVFTAAKDTSIVYKVIGYGQQNCFSDTGYVAVKTYPVPHMNFQTGEIVLSVGSSVRLVSNSSPDITQWQWQPATGLDNAGSANPVASPKQTITYSCIASNGGGCVARDEVTIRVICKNTNVFIPNTFSPNNDGMNEMFYPRGTGLFTVKSFRIFNRWGQLIFEKYNMLPNSSADGWNGTFNGKMLQPDVYVYMMEIVCENGMNIPVKGNVTLLR